MHHKSGKKAGEKAEAAAGSLWSWLARATLGDAIFWVVNITVAFYLSDVLQSLTKGALWFPESWREILGFISSLGFIAVTIIVSKVSEAKGGQHSQKHLRSAKARAVLALLFLGVAAWSVNDTKQLRDKYIFDLPQSDQWWLKLYGKPGNKTNNFTADDFKTPDYLSYGYQSVYFPYRDNDVRMTNWGPKAQADADLKGAVSPDTNDIRACIDFMLTVEPANFLNEAESQPEIQVREEVNLKFMLFHFLTIASLAAAWGLLKQEQETILDAIVDLLRPKA